MIKAISLLAVLVWQLSGNWCGEIGGGIIRANGGAIVWTFDEARCVAILVIISRGFIGAIGGAIYWSLDGANCVPIL